MFDPWPFASNYLQLVGVQAPVQLSVAQLTAPYGPHRAVNQAPTRGRLNRPDRGPGPEKHTPFDGQRGIRPLEMIFEQRGIQARGFQSYIISPEYPGNSQFVHQWVW